jgi:hypothetical protein
LAASFDLADPELWKSNSFASFKPRRIVHLEAVVADLEWSIARDTARGRKPNGDERERLDRAQAILAALTRMP